MNALFALNEGAGGELDKNEKPVALQIQAGERCTRTLPSRLRCRRPQLATDQEQSDNEARRRIGKARHVQFSDRIESDDARLLRGAEQAGAAGNCRDMRAVLQNPPDEAAAARLWAVNPGWNGTLRTTCIATEISGGHAPNALPQHARANVNCRILPGVPIDDVQQEIIKVVGDDKISVAPAGERGFQSPRRR